MVSIQEKAVVEAVCGAGMVGHCEPAAEAGIAALEMRFASLEATMEEFRTYFSAAMNRVIVSQIVVYAVLFAALKLC